jgi:hypothetical protein
VVQLTQPEVRARVRRVELQDLGEREHGLLVALRRHLPHEPHAVAEVPGRLLGRQLDGAAKLLAGLLGPAHLHQQLAQVQ